MFTGRIETDSIDVDYEKADKVLLVVNVTNSNQVQLETLLVKTRINDLDDNLPIFD